MCYVGFHLPSSLQHTEIQASPSWARAAALSPLGDTCKVDLHVPQCPTGLPTPRTWWQLEGQVIVIYAEPHQPGRQVALMVVLEVTFH